MQCVIVVFPDHTHLLFGTLAFVVSKRKVSFSRGSLVDILLCTFTRLTLIAV